MELPFNFMMMNVQKNTLVDREKRNKDSKRIKSLDVLRGFAILGILAANIGTFALPDQAGNNPDLFSSGSNLEYWSMFFSYIIFEGKTRGIFSILFGAGAFIFISNLEKKMQGVEPAVIYYRRLIWLMLIGLIHAYLLLYPGDILFTYGIVGLFLLPFVKAKPKFLIGLASGLFLLFSVGAYLFTVDIHDSAIAYEEAIAKEEKGLALDADELESKADWEEEIADLYPNQEEMAEVIAMKQGGYFDVFGTTAGDAFSAQTEGLMMVAFWDVGILMLLGIALMKMGFFQYQFKTRTYFYILLIAYGIGITIDSWIIHNELNHFEDIVAIAYCNVFYQVGRVASTIGHMTLILLLMKLPIRSWLATGLANIGKTALTNYILQTLICIFLFYGFGLGLFGKLLRMDLFYIVIASWIVQLSLSTLWLKFFRFGPLEWAWRSLTYWKRQPMLR